MLGPGVEAVACAVRVDAEAELAGDDNALAERRQGLADKLLIREWTVCLGGIEERHAALDSRADDGDGILPIHGGAVGRAEAHRAVSEGRDLRPHYPQLACL